MTLVCRIYLCRLDGYTVPICQPNRRENCGGFRKRVPGCRDAGTGLEVGEQACAEGQAVSVVGVTYDFEHLKLVMRKILVLGRAGFDSIDAAGFVVGKRSGEQRCGRAGLDDHLEGLIERVSADIGRQSGADILVDHLGVHTR